MIPFKSLAARLLTIAALTALALTNNAYSIDFNPTEDGVYAVFTTNHGEFAAKLYHEQAPVTVANFVGLAEGSVHRWDEDADKPITGKFYDGISFHRVISGFMIQGGSPNGLGTDGPGYTIPDEMQPDLKHTGSGLLSMANSGTNTGGSQFFITLGAASWLDGKHAIFGEIVSGMDNVNTIGNLDTDANDKPTTPATIISLDILRVGDAAQAFNPRDYNVPNVNYPTIDLELDPAESKASFPRIWNAYYQIRRSTDFENWDVDDTLVPDRDATQLHEIDITEDIANQKGSFLEVTEITTLKTRDATGTDLTVKLEGNDDLTIKLTSDFAGTYTFGESNGTVAGYYWYPIHQRDQLHIGFSALRTMQLYLTWTSETAGTVFAFFPETYSGAQNHFSIEGTFTANQRPGDS